MWNISTTLVVTLKKGLNDHEVGKIIEFALKQPCVRGVTFQPIQAAGRLEHYDPVSDRLTLTEVRRKILEQTSAFKPQDIIPVPCHPDSLSMAYALKLEGKVIPLTGLIPPEVLIDSRRNTIVFEGQEDIRKSVFKLFSTSHSSGSSAVRLKELLCCLPKVAVPGLIGYENIFRIIIMQFIDPKQEFPWGPHIDVKYGMILALQKGRPSALSTSAIPSNYRTEFRSVDRLSLAERHWMANLYLRYYEGTHRDRFLMDLSNKKEVLLLFFGEEFVGFTTLTWFDCKAESKTIRVIFSGDTIVERHHWGQQALAYGCLSRLGSLKRAAGNLPMYWFLIVKGHRTYRYLPAFAKSFFPHWEYERTDLKHLVDTLAEHQFGSCYNPASGLIRFNESRGHLKATFAAPSEIERKKPSVRFFLERNPDYISGTEMACLCELKPENLKPLARRLFLKGAR